MPLPFYRPPTRSLLSASLPFSTLISSMVSTTPTASTNPQPQTPKCPRPSSRFPTVPYKPRHVAYPYTPSDFTRQDPSPDASFYASPRFVTHIDDHAISALRKYYAEALPQQGRVLDFCSSWVSHFPSELEARAQAPATKTEPGLHVVGLGMNDAELAANPVLRTRILQDLNTEPIIPAGVGELDAAVCVVSIDYLTQPRAVLESLRARVRVGGRVHLVVSNRCFPTKVVGRWLRVAEPERLLMVADYLWWSGWREVQVVMVCNGVAEEEGWFGARRVDPLWVVRGTNVGEGVGLDE